MSFLWDWLFLGAMLNFRGVTTNNNKMMFALNDIYLIYIYIYEYTNTKGPPTFQQKGFSHFPFVRLSQRQGGDRAGWPSHLALGIAATTTA